MKKHTNILLAITCMMIFQLSACSSDSGTSSTSGSGSSTSSATDERADISIADSSLIEGNFGDAPVMPFTLSLSSPLSSDLVVEYSTNTVTASIYDLDIAIGSVVIPAGATEATIEVAIVGDDYYEYDETFTVHLENLPSNITAVDAEAIGTIRTDDLPPVLVYPVEMSEGDSGTTTYVFPVVLAGATNEITVDYSTADLTATLADNDYVEKSGTLTIPAGETVTSIEIEVNGDVNPEGIEYFHVVLSNIQGDAVLLPGYDYGEGKIIDDDTALVLDPKVSVTQVTPGSEAGPSDSVFAVSLNTPVTQNVSIDYQTYNLSSSNAATAGSDYIARSGRVTIPAGSTTANINVPVLDDSLTEGTEEFGLSLTLVSGNVTLVTRETTGWIHDDEYTGPPVAGVALVTRVAEGDSGSSDLIINAWLSEASANTITFDYSTVNITALAGSDYIAANGTVTFNPGETLKAITIPVQGDTFIEADETFKIHLSNVTGGATLFYDSDYPPYVIIETDDPFAMVSIPDVFLVEGDSGSNSMEFTVSIDAVAIDPVTLDYLVEDDPLAQHQALDGEDYTASSGSISILPGGTTATISVPINGDTTLEYDESFHIVLSNVSQNAEFADSIAIGTIINDDSSAGWNPSPSVLDQTSLGIFPRVVMNGSGEAMANWASNGGLHYIHSRRYTHATNWDPLETITDNQDHDTLRETWIDDSGISTLLWDDPQVIRHIPGGTGWTDYRTFTNFNLGYPKDNLRLVGNSSGEMLAVWVDATATSGVYDLTYSTFDPVTGQWSLETTLEANIPSLLGLAAAMNENGDMVVVWNQSTLGVRAIRYDATVGDWIRPVMSISRPLTATLYESGNRPDVAIDNSGNIIAVWDNAPGYGTGNTGGDIWGSRYDVTTTLWTQIQVELGVLRAAQAQVEMDPLGNAYVVWYQVDDPYDIWGDTWEIHARRFDAVGGWETDIMVQDTATRISKFMDARDGALDNPALTVDAQGNAMLAWSEDIDGNFVIRASRHVITDPLPDWSPPEQISDTSLPVCVKPSIASDAVGNAVAVWMCSNDASFPSFAPSEIWSNSYTAP